MNENTKEQLVSAASRLLDIGGQNAVTLRAVAERVGVSHNAPYRHFRDRGSLLGAVAERDFLQLRRAFDGQAEAHEDPESGLLGASGELITYAIEHKARYRLLFSDPGLVPEQSLKDAAFGSFQAFSRIVFRCQQARVLPQVDTTSLTGLIYATLHGAIDLEIGGRASESKGLGSIQETVALLFHLLAQNDARASRR